MEQKVKAQVHCLVADLVRQELLREEISSGKQDQVFERYGIPVDVRELLRTPDYRQLEKAGLPPIYRVLYVISAFPAIREHLSMAPFLARFEQDMQAEGVL